eukprot:SAG11_NODE_134_length_15338_cov_3.876435_25_plen_195_part_00
MSHARAGEGGRVLLWPRSRAAAHRTWWRELLWIGSRRHEAQRCAAETETTVVCILNGRLHFSLSLPLFRSRSRSHGISAARARSWHAGVNRGYEGLMGVHDGQYGEHIGKASWLQSTVVQHWQIDYCSAALAVVLMVSTVSRLHDPRGEQNRAQDLFCHCRWHHPVRNPAWLCQRKLRCPYRCLCCAAMVDRLN